MRFLCRNARHSADVALEFAGEAWVLESEPPPEYTCVSYAWGPGRAPHPFEPAQSISDRAVSALEAVVRVCAPKAIWLDGLCMPSEEPAKAQALLGLAAIYAQATQVAVVLSANCRLLFEQYERGQPVTTAALEQLEQEAWVKRFWTYQELAKSKEIVFLSERGTNVAIGGTELLNQVGNALTLLQKSHPAHAASLGAVDNLIDVLGAWIHTGNEPFALQIMAGMARRFGDRPADRFNAVLGAVDVDVTREGSTDLLAASERFMAACEAKGDYSFIYANAPRSDRPFRSWRPTAGDLPPILAWHTFGRGQRGSLQAKHVSLQDLHCALPAPLAPEARAFILEWLSFGPPSPGDPSLTERVLHRLQEMGFPGAQAPLELATGYFFPLADPPVTGGWAVMIASEVRWVHGAPALLVAPLSAARYRCLGVGIFAGLMPKAESQSFEIE